MSDVYFSVEEKEVKKEKRGDNVVRDYNIGNSLEYPALVLSCKEVEGYHVNLLKGLLNSKSLVTQVDTYNTYISINGTHVLVGTLSRDKLRTVITSSLFKNFNIKVYQDEETDYEGVLLLALCKATI